MKSAYCMTLFCFWVNVAAAGTIRFISDLVPAYGGAAFVLTGTNLEYSLWYPHFIFHAEIHGPAWFGEDAPFFILAGHVRRYQPPVP